MNSLLQCLIENGSQLAKRVRRDSESNVTSAPAPVVAVAANDADAFVSTCGILKRGEYLGPQFELFFSLPEEIGMHIMSFLDARDICHFSTASKECLRFGSENTLWKKACKRRGWKVSRPARREYGYFDYKQYFSEKDTISRPNALTWSETFKTHGTAPSKRFKHTATVVGKNVVFIGGQETDTKRFNEIIFFNSETSSFSRPSIKGTVPNFSRHTSVSINEKLYVFGGFDGFGTNFDLAVFDPVKYIWTNVPKTDLKGTCPVSRTNHAAAAVGSKMFIFGGNNNNEAGQYQVLGDFHCLDADTMTWSQPETTGEKPTARSGHCMTAIGTKLFLFGGGVWNETNGWVDKFTDVYVLDTETMHWTKPTTSGVIETSTFAISFAIGRFLFVFGGGSKPKHCVTNDLYILDTTTYQWSSPEFAADVKPQPRDMGIACAVNNNVYFMGGYAGGAVEYFNKLSFDCKPVFEYNPPSLSQGLGLN